MHTQLDKFNYIAAQFSVMKVFTSEQITKELQDLFAPPAFFQECKTLWNAIFLSYDNDLLRTRVYFRALVDTIQI